jgi:hypothetical protein
MKNVSRGQNWMGLQEVVQLLRTAIEASVYVAPTEPGLTGAELFEVAKRLGLKDGEIGDAIPQVATQTFGGPNPRLMLKEHHWHMSSFLIFGEDPELRNPAAFDFVVSQLNELVRDVGGRAAWLDRSILVDRAEANGIARHDIEIAITLMILGQQLIEELGVLRFKHAMGGADGNMWGDFHDTPTSLLRLQ